MQNLISCRPESYGRYVAKAYESLQRLGVKHVEIAVPAPENVDRVAGELREHGLQASSVAFYNRLQEPDFLQRVAAVVDAAAALEAPVIFTSQHAGDTGPAAVYERLRQAGEIASKKGVKIALETHPDLCVNSRAALETMQGVGHPNICINFDPANIHYYNRDIDAVTELKAVAPYVRAVHLKDTNGGFEQHNFPAIGDGVVNWKAIFAVMNEQEMFGPFTLEMEGIAGEDLTFEETHARIQRSLDHLRSIGVM